MISGTGVKFLKEIPALPFADRAQQQLDAVLIDDGGSFLAQRVLIVELARKYRLPVIYPYRDCVDLGGLNPEQI